MVQVGFLERDRSEGDPRHGTPSGALRHSKAGELPCDACRAAKAEYDKRYRSSSENQRKNRLHAKAQAKAYGDLRRAHLDEYTALYVKHKAALISEHIQAEADTG